MNWHAWVVLVVLIASMVVMAFDLWPTSVTMGVGLLVLLVSGASSSEVVLSGLSSPATVTIGALYVIAAAVSMTGALSTVIDRMLFGRLGHVGRLAATTASISAFVANTPLVALAAPRVLRWCRRHGADASRYLIPLSYASILGGVITTLGTSTNLVVSDLLRDSQGRALGVFEITKVGLPVAIVGVVVLALTAPRLLGGSAKTAVDAVSERHFESQMIVMRGGPLDGVTVNNGGLRNLDGLYLAAIERNGQTTAAAGSTMLEGGDHLYFVGDVGHLVDLHDVAGLASAEEPHVLDTEGAGVGLYEAVVGGGSDLAGRSLKDSGFRARYGAAVVAVRRADAGVRGKLGRVPLHIGDVLVILAPPDFNTRWRDYGDFSLVASLDEAPPRRRNRALLAALVLPAVVIASVFGVDLMVASLVGAAVLVAGGALSLSEARHAIDLNVMITIAASIGLGDAVAKSGLADQLAEYLVRFSTSAPLGIPLGRVGLMAMVIIATQIVTEVLSNSGAAAIMVPIAMVAASQIGADPRPYAIGVLVGASCSFLTPVGYQTNLMVYSLGGYRFRDFTRVGLPLTVMTTIVATLILSHW